MTDPQNAGDVRTAVMAEALTWKGTPYRHQGTRKGVGADCLGLVRGVWRSLYGNEPENPGSYSQDWAVAASAEERLLAAARRHCHERDGPEVRAGDLLVFRWRPHLPASHAGIALGNDRFIHAYERTGVVISSLVPQWRRRIAGVFAFPPMAAAYVSSKED